VDLVSTTDPPRANISRRVTCFVGSIIACESRRRPRSAPPSSAPTSAYRDAANRMGCLKGGVVANVVVPTPGYVRFAAAYGFRPDFCEAADPESKGVVEALVGSTSLRSSGSGRGRTAASPDRPGRARATLRLEVRSTEARTPCSCWSTSARFQSGPAICRRWSVSHIPRSTESRVPGRTHQEADDGRNARP
jgi:hypothetical protein